MKRKKAESQILEKISSPEDIKNLNDDELNTLAREIRELLIHRITENGGHLASNLGVVELTLAIHRVFSSPKDHIIFDVGHQSYVHKLLTGRKEQFKSLRRGGGISGFPKRSESEHDCFGTGHSSTSLSAALGFAEADRLSGSDAYTICVFGDGAYTGGMIHEALNNSKKKLRLIMIINENEMSISKNIGRFAKSLSHLRSSKGYLRTKSATATVLNHIPLIGKSIFSFLLRAKIAIKSALYGSNYFENLGLCYYGPVDGNNESAVEQLLQEAKRTGQSCVVHVKTKKGKGYPPAEATPDRFHGMAPADKPTIPVGETFSEVMGNNLVQFANRNDKICAITAAMAGGTGLQAFRSALPNRFFDVGIAEEHAVTFAAGLAANGYRPVVAIYSTFLQRAYDNVIHDVALQNLPVVFCIDRAGLNAADGATHHGIFDVAFLSHIPNLKIYTPITKQALYHAMNAALQDHSPCAIRYPSGCESCEVVECFYQHPTDKPIAVRSDYAYGSDKAEELDAVLITDGRIVTEAIKAKKVLLEKGIQLGILLLEQLRPYDNVAKEISMMLPQKACKIIFLEEEIRSGGMGMLLSDALSCFEIAKNKKFSLMALDDDFVIQTKDESIWKTAGLDCESIVRQILN